MWCAAFCLSKIRGFPAPEKTLLKGFYIPFRREEVGGGGGGGYIKNYRLGLQNFCYWSCSVFTLREKRKKEEEGLFEKRGVKTKNKKYRE
jgi:hypothetical protein